MARTADITRRQAVTLLGTAVASPLVAVKATAAEVEVKISDFAFSPPELTVKVGSTVTWVNEDDAPHTVDSIIGSFKSGALDTNESFKFTFSMPGSYRYFCGLHPHMTGTVLVEAVAGSDKLR